MATVGSSGSQAPQTSVFIVTSTWYKRVVKGRMVSRRKVRLVGCSGLGRGCVTYQIRCVSYLVRMVMASMCLDTLCESFGAAGNAASDLKSNAFTDAVIMSVKKRFVVYHLPNVLLDVDCR